MLCEANSICLLLLKRTRPDLLTALHHIGSTLLTFKTFFSTMCSKWTGFFLCTSGCAYVYIQHTYKSVYVWVYIYTHVLRADIRISLHACQCVHTKSDNKGSLFYLTLYHAISFSPQGTNPTLLWELALSLATPSLNPLSFATQNQKLF